MLNFLLQAAPKPYFYGGQAVLEGVMMRGARSMAVAVRRQNGEIVVHEETLSGPYAGTVRNIPLVRGVLTLAETLTLGVRALLFSTNVALEDEGEEELGSGAVAGMLTFSLAFIAGIFFIAPLVAVGLLDRVWDGGGHTTNVIIEGVLRLGLFFAYVWAIGLMPDIRRTFAYHGAEHRAIHCWEAGDSLTVRNVLRFPNEHPRCGTGFLLVVMVVAIGVFAFVGDLPWWGLVLSRILLIPVIAAIAYEIVRFSAAFWHHRLVRAVFTPSLRLQAFTTRDPDADQVEVAIAALSAVLAADGVAASRSTETHFSPAVT
ncbi:MAG TPA: DUF1385 domain-containing protein [Dehalococcoidia bacterium]|nr:DUF1385 domain-containing protein [Dehalococcoidia bacterium]